jgi:hypothetical protein
MQAILIDSDLTYSQSFETIKLIFSITDHADNAAFAWAGNNLPPQHLVAGATVTTGGTSITQAEINALLGSTDEFEIAKIFGTTAMVADNAMGFVLNCKGQVKNVSSVRATVSLVDGTCVSLNGIGTTSELADADFTATPAEVEVSPEGNIAGRLYLTNLSLATSGPGFVTIEMDAIFN